jgi:hypothetical protein
MNELLMALLGFGGGGGTGNYVGTPPSGVPMPPTPEGGPDYFGRTMPLARMQPQPAPRPGDAGGNKGQVAPASGYGQYPAELKNPEDVTKPPSDVTKPPTTPPTTPPGAFQLPATLPEKGVTVTHGPNEWLNYLHYVGAPKFQAMPEGWQAPGDPGQFAPWANWQWPPPAGGNPLGTTPPAGTTDPSQVIRKPAQRYRA